MKDYGFVTYGTDEWMRARQARQREMEACGTHDFDWDVVYTTYPPQYRCRKCRHLMSARAMRLAGIQPMRGKWEDGVYVHVIDDDDYGVPLGGK